MKHPRGFTLIEVVVAAAIFGIAATALFGLLSTSLSNLRKIEDIHRYQLAAEDTMNRVLLLSKLPPGGTIEGVIESPPGRWLVTVTPWIPEKLEDNAPEAIMKVDVEVRWAGRAGERSLKIESLRAAALSYANDNFTEAIENALPE